MKIFKKFLIISLTFSILSNALADNNNLSGGAVHDFFDMFIHEMPNKEFLNDKNVSYSEFLNYFYSSFKTKNPKYTVRKMYKLVRQINYKSKDTKLLYFAIKNNLIEVNNKKFNLDDSITKEDLLKFQSYLIRENFQKVKKDDYSQPIDYYENFLLDVYKTINDKYFFKDDISKQKLVYGAINGMVESLDDPHSSFQTPQEKQNFLDSLNQELEGIGASMMLNENKQFQVITPLKGSPALKAGLMPGDIVVSVNGIDLSGKTIQEGISLIKGPKGTKVKLTVKRGTKFLDFYITRAKIDIPLVSGSIVENKNLLLDIRSFGVETFKKVEDILNKHNTSKIENIIIDLRSNPGGYLNSAIMIADLFLSQNQEIVSTTKSNGNLNSIIASKDNSIDKNIYFMTNKGTASASEILILALQEYKNVKVYGEKTYGKGSLQELLNFSDDSALKLTVGLWLGPKKKSINKLGISPDVYVKTSAQDILNDNDPVLNKILIDTK
ncbi:hypothetical protein CL656_06630 [bacterium]|nr:hypothetical protein [bacterium]